MCTAAALSEAAFSSLAWTVPKPYSWEAMPPNGNGEAFVRWMVANRGEDTHFLAQRFTRYQTLVANRDVLDDRNKRAFLMTPREEFTLKCNQGRAYDQVPYISFAQWRNPIAYRSDRLTGVITTPSVPPMWNSDKK